jgi:3alpha(or 20beta)-hydroxysteroid dehydrogenase
MGRLDGKIAIITGAARGMGEASARLFVAEGASVLLTDVLDAEGVAVAAELGETAKYQQLDVTDEAAWGVALKVAVAEFGTPDVLVNNAGVLRFGPLLTTDVAELRTILDINLIGPFLGMKVIGAAMTAAGRGSIVNISSTGGMVGMSTIGAYVSSKWGLRGLTKTAAIEFGPLGVRVNSVHPGGVTTAMVGVSPPALVEPPAPGKAETDPALAAADRMAEHQPVPRLGRPVEIARAVVFLASDESSYCTGAEFVVDGGSIAGPDLAA